jgi:predicted heme/steroid binding protein
MKWWSKNGAVPGRPMLIAYKGHVYDVTGHVDTGKHFWLHADAGLTSHRNEWPHGEEMSQRAVCAGQIAYA